MMCIISKRGGEDETPWILVVRIGDIFIHFYASCSIYGFGCYGDHRIEYSKNLDKIWSVYYYKCQFKSFFDSGSDYDSDSGFDDGVVSESGSDDGSSSESGSESGSDSESRSDDGSGSESELELESGSNADTNSDQ